METQYVPAYEALDSKGVRYARIAPTSFPRDAMGDSPVLHRVVAYDKSALWDAVKSWFDGGEPAIGRIDVKATAVHTFSDKGGSTWKIYPPSTAKEKKFPLTWNAFASPVALDPTTYGYRWKYDLVAKTESSDGSLVTLPEYFRFDTKSDEKAEWVVVQPDEVPVETGLRASIFRRPESKPAEAYVTPEESTSSWKKPGPVAGPFEVKLGDGSHVTYYWYRFADQPSILNADMTDAEREALQVRVEKLHRHWSIDLEYLPPPTIGTLAELDPAVIVTPPKGLEIGYVPIVTRQGFDRESK